MKSVLARTLALVGLTLTVAACAASNDSTLCTCAADEKFDGEACVAAAEFTAPTCESDDVAVCGCDEAAYSSSCAAHTAGVEVKNAGSCSAPSNSGGGFGW